MARAAYRAVNGALTLTNVQSTVHPLNETDGSLSLANLAFTAGVKRALANDITVCGENEPVAYVTEYFLGEGSRRNSIWRKTRTFLHRRRPRSSASCLMSRRSTRALGCFRRSGYLTLGTGGLAMNGGNGIDGQTLLTWLDPVEMGGTLLLEAVG